MLLVSHFTWLLIWKLLEFFTKTSVVDMLYMFSLTFSKILRVVNFSLVPANPCGSVKIWQGRGEGRCGNITLPALKDLKRSSTLSEIVNSSSIKIFLTTPFITMKIVKKINFSIFTEETHLEDWKEKGKVKKMIYYDTRQNGITVKIKDLTLIIHINNTERRLD